MCKRTSEREDVRERERDLTLDSRVKSSLLEQGCLGGGGEMTALPLCLAGRGNVEIRTTNEPIS